MPTHIDNDTAACAVYLQEKYGMYVHHLPVGDASEFKAMLASDSPFAFGYDANTGMTHLVMFKEFPDGSISFQSMADFDLNENFTETFEEDKWEEAVTNSPHAYKGAESYWHDLIAAHGLSIYRVRKCSKLAESPGYEFDGKPLVTKNDLIDYLSEKPGEVKIHIFSMNNGSSFIADIISVGYGYSIKYTDQIDIFNNDWFATNREFFFHDYNFDNKIISVVKRSAKSQEDYFKKNNIITISNLPFKRDDSEPEHTQLAKFFASDKSLPPKWRPGMPI